MVAALPPPGGRPRQDQVACGELRARGPGLHTQAELAKSNSQKQRSVPPPPGHLVGRCPLWALECLVSTAQGWQDPHRPEEGGQEGAASGLQPPTRAISPSPDAKDGVASGPPHTTAPAPRWGPGVQEHGLLGSAAPGPPLSASPPQCREVR